MKGLNRFILTAIITTVFSSNAFAGFKGEAWLAPDRCTQLIERSECEDYAGGSFDCSTTYESHEKRMEFFVDDWEYLESQWPGYGEDLQRLGQSAAEAWV